MLIVASYLDLTMNAVGLNRDPRMAADCPLGVVPRRRLPLGWPAT